MQGEQKPASENPDETPRSPSSPPRTAPPDRQLPQSIGLVLFKWWIVFFLALGGLSVFLNLIRWLRN